MKKIDDFYFTVANILSSARNFEQFHFFYQLLESGFTWFEQSRFFCRAVDIFKKSIKQSRFEQLHFEQLTLTHLQWSKFLVNEMKGVKRPWNLFQLLILTYLMYWRCPNKSYWVESSKVALLTESFIWRCNFVSNAKK